MHARFDMNKKINWLGLALSISLITSLVVSFRYAQVVVLLLEPIPEVCIFHQSGPYVDEYNQPREATEYEKGCDQIIEQREQARAAGQAGAIFHLVVWLGWHISLVFWLKYWFAHRHNQHTFVGLQKKLLQIFTTINHFFSILAGGVSVLILVGIVMSGQVNSGMDALVFAAILAWLLLGNILAVLAKKQGKLLNALFLSALPTPVATTILFAIFLLSRSGLL